MHIQFKEQDLHLLPQKAIYWAQQKALLIADLHLGKVAHFRKEGFAIPQTAGYKNFEVLEALMGGQWPVEKILFLGDLFHSTANHEWALLEEWISQYPGVEMILVKGNHDILPAAAYSQGRIKVVDSLQMGPFSFAHHPVEAGKEDQGTYTFCGHLHPGARLSGGGRQQLTLPCFWLGRYQGVLPAFGSFTGLHIIKPSQGDRVFVVAGERVMQVPLV
jgi:uncharacterized protein